MKSWSEVKLSLLRVGRERKNAWWFSDVKMIIAVSRHAVTVGGRVRRYVFR